MKAKTLAGAICLIGLLVLNSCFPDDYGLDPFLEGFERIGGETIGPEGGDIILDEIIVEVPAGAIEGNATMNIYIDTVSANNPIIDKGFTPVFMIDKLPEVLFKPITVKIPWHDEIIGDTLIAIGTETFSKSMDSTFYSYTGHQARIEGGFLVCELFAQIFDLKSGGTGNPFGFGTRVTGLNNFRLIDSNEKHFRVFVQNKHLAHIQDMLNYFELAFTEFEKMGFDLTGRNYPVSILMSDKVFKENPTPGEVTDFAGAYHLMVDESDTDEDIKAKIHHGNFQIKPKYLSIDKTLKFIIFHEFTHFVQNLYEFSDPHAEGQMWFSEASANWAGGLIIKDQDYVHWSVQKPNLTIFDGLVQRSYYPHAYSMLFMCQGLEKYYDPIMLNIFEGIRSGKPPDNCINPTDVIGTIIEDPIELVWFNVLNDYLQGKFQGGQDAKLIWGAYLKKVGAFTFNNETDTILYSQGDDYYNLSAQMYFFDFDNLDMTNQFQLELSLPNNQMNGLGIYTYDEENGAVQIGTIQPGSNEKYIVNNLQTIKKANQYVACLMTIGDHDEDCMGHTWVDMNYQLTKDDGGGEIRDGYWEVSGGTYTYTSTSFPEENFSASNCVGSFRASTIADDPDGGLQYSFSLRDPITNKGYTWTAHEDGETFFSDLDNLTRTITTSISVGGNAVSASRIETTFYKKQEVTHVRKWVGSGVIER